MLTPRVLTAGTKQSESFRAKTRGRFSHVWESFHEIGGESEIDREKGEKKKKKSPEKWTKTMRNAEYLYIWKCVCIRRKWEVGAGRVGTDAGLPSAASVLRLVQKHERIVIVQKRNPIPRFFFYLLELLSVTPATFAVLLFIHYLWQCKWLITFKMAPKGEQTPGMMWMKSWAFRLRPSSLGPKIPVRVEGTAEGKLVFFAWWLLYLAISWPTVNKAPIYGNYPC